MYSDHCTAGLTDCVTISLGQTAVLQYEGSPAGQLLRHPEPDPLVPLHQLYQLVPEQLIQHRVETFQFRQPEEIPL